MRLVNTTLLMLFGLVACTSTKKMETKTQALMPEGLEKTIIDGLFHVTENMTIQNDVVIFPSAYIQTHSDKRLRFLGRVDIVGESHVFDVNCSIEFGPGTVSKLNPAWFGAKGYDQENDTKAFLKTVALANQYYNSIVIEVPIGNYYISETLEVGNNPQHNKSISWSGVSMSNSTVQGSSLLWTGEQGGTMMKFNHVSAFFIENLDFNSNARAFVKCNLEFRPFVHLATIRHCSFTGCGGQNSCNINWNVDNGEQVSEILISSCIFNGAKPEGSKVSTSAIKGGYANTKNIYIKQCGFSDYAEAAIDINITEILHVEGCTFANNDIDISCLLCGSYVVANYSEHSHAFFNSGVSANLAFSTLIGNSFVGTPENGFVVRDGSGSLLLLHNNFGGGGQEEEMNQVRWEARDFNRILSIGNFFKNADKSHYPFFNRTGQPNPKNVISIQDIGGRTGEDRRKIQE